MIQNRQVQSKLVNTPGKGTDIAGRHMVSKQARVRRSAYRMSRAVVEVSRGQSDTRGGQANYTHVSGMRLIRQV